MHTTEEPNKNRIDKKNVFFLVFVLCFVFGFCVLFCILCFVFCFVFCVLCFVLYFVFHFIFMNLVYKVYILTQWPTGPHDITAAVAFVTFVALAIAAWRTIAAAIIGPECATVRLRVLFEQ